MITESYPGFAVKLFLLIIVLLPGFVSLHGESELVTVSSYRTSVEDQDSSVKTNIAIAASKLNGIVIPSGGVFSFNETVGEGSAANGFLTGRVLYQDAAVYESGGGICQVSSTLFNAMLLAGCSIAERHRHSRQIRYVPPGLDATIRYGKKDLRMRNPNPFPFYIYTSINDKSFIIMIKSEKSIEASYEVFTEEEEVRLPFNNNEDGMIKQGLSIYVYRKKIKNGKTENTLLYKDFYPPVQLEK